MCLAFSEAVRLHRQHLRAKRRAAKTVVWYGEQFAVYERWRLAAGLPDALPDADTLEAFMADQNEAELRPSTVHARFRALRALLNFPSGGARSTGRRIRSTWWMRRQCRRRSGATSQWRRSTRCWRRSGPRRGSITGTG